MPYAIPSPDDHHADLPPLKLKPKHRRTRSSGIFSDEKGPGAFVAMPHLPKRKPSRAVFHIRGGEDHDSDSSDDSPPPITKSNSLGLTVDTSTLPFPSPPSPDSPPPSSLPRTPSTPVILSNGKPLKPSLKSSHSSPNIPGIRHSRAQSEPTTPHLKNVHFPEQEGALQSVRLFRQSAKPANLGKTDETETETEYDSSSVPARAAAAGSDLSFSLQLDPLRSSPVPSLQPPQYTNVHLESMVLPTMRPLLLRGSVLVRNIAFTKEVVVRFTLDEWQTTSEVACKYVASLPSLPQPFREAATPGDQLVSSNWDRFSFSISLDDFERKLSERTLYMVVRYTVPGQGEWWDNNQCQNYRASFVTKPVSPVSTHSQQSSFAAPPTLRTTPATPILSRSHSAPSSSVGMARPQPKLSLLNYAAPISPPQTPPHLRYAALPVAQDSIVGGQPATSVMSPTAVERQMARDFLSSPTNDSSYNSFVRQWCFAQTPSSATSVPPKDVWFQPYSSGVYGATLVGSH